MSSAVQHEAIDALIRTLFSNDPRVVEASVRALKLIYQSGQVE